MSVVALVNQAVAWYAASAVLAFLFSLRKPLSGAIAGIGGAVASAMLIVAGFSALIAPERINGGMLQYLHLAMRVAGLTLCGCWPSVCRRCRFRCLTFPGIVIRRSNRMACWLTCCWLPPPARWW